MSVMYYKTAIKKSRDLIYFGFKKWRRLYTGIAFEEGDSIRDKS